MRPVKDLMSHTRAAQPTQSSTIGHPTAQVLLRARAAAPGVPVLPTAPPHRSAASPPRRPGQRAPARSAAARATRGPAYSVPHTKRISGPKVAADGKPTKYSPGTADS